METERRQFLGGLAVGTSMFFASTAARAADGDGHAAGSDVSSSSAFMRTIPRKSGDASAFTASLDNGPIKSTSGGWARDITSRQLPIATGIAGAHLYLNPGGVREMHWHSSAEWGYVVEGHCQVTIVDPEGATEIVNCKSGDTWYFPAGHAHSIQALGMQSCHAILAFDDGLYGDHGTFGLTDWLSRISPDLVAASYSISPAAAHRLPEGETYIMQGSPVLLGSPYALAEKRMSARKSHRYSLDEAKPVMESAAGSLRVASSKQFPLSTTLTGFTESLQPGAIHAPHWHPGANEWVFVVKGHIRASLFEPEKRMATAELKPGDCAYFPRAAGHMLENIGTDACQIIGVFDSGSYQECTLGQWFAAAPKQVIAANLGLNERDLAGLPAATITFRKAI